MATKHLGADFDIHGGGLDLVFPHHESERAIGEAWCGERYCNYYLHNGFVTVGNEKMSKSLGNFVTVKEMLASHDPEALRAFLLSAHYRAPLNYDDASIAAAASRVARWREAAARAGAGAPEHADAFWAALLDDFHFDRALAALDAECARAAPSRAFLREAGDALGLLWSASES
jgi:cysteinyl-tRNA synthetase